MQRCLKSSTEVCRHHWSSEISKLSRAFGAIKAGRGKGGKAQINLESNKSVWMEGAGIVELRAELCAGRGETRNELADLICHNPKAPETRIFFSNFHLVVVKPFNNVDPYIYITIYTEILYIYHYIHEF